MNLLNMLEHGCNNIRSVSIPLLDAFVITKVRETLSNSHQLKETFKKEVLKEKKVGQKDTWEYERLVRVEKTRRTHLEKQVDQLRSSLAEIESNILVGDIDDKELSDKVKEKVIAKFKDAKDKLEKCRQKITQLQQENSWIDWLSKYHEHYLDWEKFSKEELQYALNQFVDKINVTFDSDKNEHIISIKFKLPLVKDKFQYKDPTNKRKGYSIKKGKEEIKGKIPFQKGGRPPKNASLHHHSTVTDLAKLRGLSISVPLIRAVW